MMTKTKGIFYKISSLLLILLMLISSTVAFPVSASAATTTKTEKSYDIAVVFDNSGSMYMNKGWSRAKYAMEIFASMLDYDDGDKLSIYPMWEVTTDGKTKTGGSYKAIEIKSAEDINNISRLYTTHPSNTPIEPAKEAWEYMKTSDATDRWIIVLTDGEFNQEVRGKNVGTFSEQKLKSKLLSYATNGINVQYLGFGEASKLESEPSKNFYAKKSTDTSLKDDLIGICNSIFQRAILPGKYLSGKKLSLDISMKNIIVFAQGSNAKISSLESSSGKEIKETLDSGQRKYNSIRAKGYENAPIDTSLAGQVVTFAACEKGEYILNYSSADKIQVFYEPDVDIAVTLTNNDGEKVDASKGEITAGEYKINAKIVDAQTGEDVTNHELMGNDVKLTTKIKTSSDKAYKNYENGAKITLTPDSSTDIVVEGTYLKDYKITSEGSKDLDWLKDLKVKNPEVDFKVKATVEQEGAWYKLSDNKEWKPITVKLTAKGKNLTEQQLLDANLRIENDKGLKYRIEPVPEKSEYKVYVSQDEAGKYVEPETGAYTPKFTATYTDEYGKKTNDSDTSYFEIQSYSQFWRWLMWVVIAAVIILLWLLFMLQKVMPKNIVKDTADFTCLSAGAGGLGGGSVDVNYNRKSKTLNLKGPGAVDIDEQCNITLNLKPIDNRFVRSKRRRFAVVGMSVTCEKVKLGGTDYVNIEGKWVKKAKANAVAAGATAPPLEQEMSCNPRFTISREPDGAWVSTLRVNTKTK